MLEKKGNKMSQERTSYFRILKETSEAVHPLILQVLEDIKKRDDQLFSAAYPPLLDRYFQRRPLQKPTLLRLSFEAAGGDNWNVILGVSAALEILNLSTYLGNLGLDGKGYAKSVQERCRQFLAASTCREVASLLLLDNVPDHLIDKLPFLFRSVANVYSEIHFGQHLDLSKFGIFTIDSIQDLAEFEPIYERRCFELSGLFNATICEIGATLAGGNTAIVNDLKKFGQVFGTGLQIVNDLADCTPAEWEPLLGKDYQGNFADLSNGRISLAVAHCLANIESPDREWLLERVGDQTMTLEKKNHLSKLLWKTGSVHYVYGVVNAYFLSAKRYLNLVVNPSTKSFLGTMASILSCNKYWKAWKIKFGALES